VRKTGEECNEESGRKKEQECNEEIGKNEEECKEEMGGVSGGKGRSVRRKYFVNNEHRSREHYKVVQTDFCTTILRDLF